MTEGVLIALITFAGVAVTAGPNYLAHRTTRRRNGEAIDAALAPLATRLDQLADDVADIRVSVAVHEDRFTRPILRPVAENRITPEARG